MPAVSNGLIAGIGSAPRIIARGSFANGRGIVKEEMGDLEGAQADLDRAVSIRSNN
ncbi:MAG: hypothetical protein QGI34_20800 [Candidatus Latescibacteria bacterium]|jgi:hypothetical protein|nr:hypothetical protein [Candidatus Latescibacterota bacterium]